MINFIDQSIKTKSNAILSYANVQAINLAFMLPWFKDFLNCSDVVFCDGFGVRWGARLLGSTLPQRNTPPDWIPQLCEQCAQNKYTIYLLGAAPGVAERAANCLREKFPLLQIVGTQHGYFDKTPGNSENKAVVAQI